MGHATDTFLKKPDDSIICSICLDVLEDAASFKKCGHTFCAKCISACLSKPTCPTCRRSVQTGSNPNYILRDLIGKLEVRCPEYSSDRKSPSTRHRMDDGQNEAVERSSHDDDETGCDWSGIISELDQHVADECEFTVIECGEEGCKHTCRRRDMGAHKSSQQSIIAHMKLKHQNELTAIELVYERKLTAMEKEYEEKCERKYEWMNQRILELERRIPDMLKELACKMMAPSVGGAPKFVRSTRSPMDGP